MHCFCRAGATVGQWGQDRAPSWVCYRDFGVCNATGGRKDPLVAVGCLSCILVLSFGVKLPWDGRWDRLLVGPRTWA